MDISVGIKYCGGCNPGYDRRVIEDIVIKLNGVKTFYYNESEIPDVTLVICGCSADCMRIDRYKSKYKTFLINDPAQLEKVVQYINFVKMEKFDSDNI